MIAPDFATLFDVDFERGVLTWRDPPKNHAEKAGRGAGYINVGAPGKKTYWQVRAFSQTFKRSRVIFAMAHGRWPEPALDHIDGDSLNDALSNLRECTLSQNGANQRRDAREAVTGLPMGVYRTRQGRFMARMTCRGRTRNLGTFATTEAALAAYQVAKKEAFGEFA